ncbi:MAG: hypothetical protein ABH851_06930 [Methanobacteriota archaeon]
MAVERVNSGNADYIVELGSHTGGPPRIAETSPFREADAFVLEGFWTPPSGKQPSKTEHAEKYVYESFKQDYPEIYAEAQRTGKTLWSVDAQAEKTTLERVADLPLMLVGGVIGYALTRKILGGGRQGELSRRSFLKKSAFTVGGILSGALLADALPPHKIAKCIARFKEGEMPDWLLEVGVASDDIIKGARREGRSVLTIHKTDSYIAPLLEKRVGRTPLIYVWMGAGHLSLPMLIKNQEYRQQVLQCFSPPERYFQSPVLRDCVEYYFNSDGLPYYKIHENAIRFSGKLETENSELSSVGGTRRRITV